MNNETPMPEARLRAGVAALGYGFNESILAATRELYAPAIKARAQSGHDANHEVEPDIAYGSDERHTLDVYRGARSGSDNAKLPVVVYVHGGGFVAGNKRSDDVFYGNIGHYFAGAGCVAVIINYRLAPAHTWPAGPSDVKAAMEWIGSNIGKHGGDPARVFLMGQSAGAAHSAAYLFDPDFCAHASAHVKAAMLLNGVYHFAAPLGGGTLAYFGGDESTYARRSPLNHIANSKVPLMIGVSQFDPPLFVTQGYNLASAVTQRDGRSPIFHWMEGHNHVSIVQSLGSGQDDVGTLLRRFIASFN